MSRRVCIVSPEYPPRTGGVVDHTRLLAAHLAEAGDDVSVLTSCGARRGAGVYAEVKDWHNGEELMLDVGHHVGSSHLIWQYVPHSYGRGGVNRAVPKVMAALAGRVQSQIVIAHEIQAPLSAWPHRLYYALCQRAQWEAILRTADGIGISTEVWLQHWRQRLTTERPLLRLLPSGATIPVHPVDVQHQRTWRGQLGLPAQVPIIGSFGAPARAAEFGRVVEAWLRLMRERGPIGLVAVGGGAWASRVPPEHRRLFCAPGHQSEREISCLLQSCSVLALPFPDGVSERRTTFFAGLSHGCAVVCNVGPNTGPMLQQQRGFLGVPVGDGEGWVRAIQAVLFEPPTRVKLGAVARAEFLARYDWPVILREVCRMMGGTGPRVVLPAESGAGPT